MSSHASIRFRARLLKSLVVSVPVPGDLPVNQYINTPVRSTSVHQSLSAEVLLQDLFLVNLAHRIAFNRIDDFQNRRDLIRRHILLQMGSESLEIDLILVTSSLFFHEIDQSASCLRHHAAHPHLHIGIFLPPKEKKRKGNSPYCS